MEDKGWGGPQKKKSYGDMLQNQPLGIWMTPYKMQILVYE